VQENEMRVTFGQKCSLFIEIRTLYKLVYDESSNDENNKNYQSSGSLCRLHSYRYKLTEAPKLTQKLITVFKKVQFKLRKWPSNFNQLFAQISLERQDFLSITFEEKVLGLKWGPKVDSLNYQYQPCPVKFSKQAIISEIASVIDHLGLLTPVSTDLKILKKYFFLVEVNWMKRYLKKH